MTKVKKKYITYFIKGCLHFGDNCSNLGLFKKAQKYFYVLKNALD
jgi:hypothetical protein